MLITESVLVSSDHLPYSNIPPCRILLFHVRDIKENMRELFKGRGLAARWMDRLNINTLE